MITLPHKGNIVKLDQLSYYTSYPNSSDSVPFVGKSTTLYKDVGVGLLKYSSPIGTFFFLPPNFPHNVSQINMITSSTSESSEPWKVPLELELTLCDSEIPLSPFKLAYLEVQSFSNRTTSENDRVNTIIDDYSRLSHLESISMPNPFYRKI